MTTPILLVCYAAWWIIGVAGFVYWWTRDWDLTTSELVTCFMAGVCGPVAFLAGWLSRSPANNKPKVLITRRRQ